MLKSSIGYYSALGFVVVALTVLAVASQSIGQAVSKALGF